MSSHLGRDIGLQLALCVSVIPASWAYGEADSEGRPSLEERALLVLTNQVRQAPHSWPDWDTSLASATALKPVAGKPDLFDAARFHAIDMAQNNHFAHESADGTPFSSRIRRYFSGASGENIYKSTRIDPYAAMTGWMNSEGHRTNILKPEWTWLGTGYSQQAPYHYYVQNFGQNGAREPEMIPAASAIWNLGERVRLIANFYDENGQRPTRIQASLGARCVDLTLVSGSNGNGTYQSDQTEPRECSDLVFWGQTSGSATLFRYPSTGALRVGPGCTADFSAQTSASSSACGGNVSEQTYIDAQDSGGCICLRSNSAAPSTFLLVLLGFAYAVRRRNFD